MYKKKVCTAFPYLSLTEHENKEDVELMDDLIQLFLCQLLVSLISIFPLHLLLSHPLLH